jgi:transcriptional regulator with XRE-family HTH domain
VDIAQRFAENLIRHRKLAGMTQEELAWRASIHRTQISLIESGKRSPRLETLVKLAGALSISPDQLLEGISWAPAPSAQEGEFRVSEPKDE